ncbi:MAG: vWA domain-containing protein [Acidimicrobiales bacterium]
MEILAPAAAAAFVAVPAIVALYVLKVRGPRVTVAGLALWPSHLADRQADTPWRRLRPSWLLVLQLLVATAVALALMRPGLVGAAGPAGITVVLIDGSATMTATDVAPSRFEAAVARARQLASEVGPDRQMAVAVVGPRAQLLASPTADPAALRSALDRARPSGQAANLDEGLSLANALVAGRPGGSVVLLGDGVTAASAAPADLAAPLRFERIGTSAENVALAPLTRGPGDDVVVRATNRGSTGRDLQVEMRADGRLVDLVAMRAEAGSTAELAWPGLPEGTAVLEARLNPGDDLSLDDAAWLVTEAPTARRALVVRRGGEGFLTRALGVRRDLQITVVEPDAYRPDAYRPGDWDLYVFDGFVPDGPLPGPALVIDPPEGRGPVPAGPQADPGPVLPANPREPLLAYVSLRDVHVQSAATVTPPPEWRTVVAGADGPLVLVNRGRPRLAQITFDIHRSDLPLRSAFPILVNNLVSHLVGSAGAGEVVAVGQAVPLAEPPGTEVVTVTGPGGQVQELRPPLPATFRDTDRAGVYTVVSDGPDRAARTTRFVVGLADPNQSRIAPGDAPAVRTVAATGADDTEATLELWPLLAGALFALVIFESLVFLRG